MIRTGPCYWFRRSYFRLCQGHRVRHYTAAEHHPTNLSSLPSIESTSYTSRKSSIKTYVYATLFFFSAGAGSYIATVLYHENFVPKRLSGFVENAPLYETIHQTKDHLTALVHRIQTRYASLRDTLQKWSPLSLFSRRVVNGSTKPPSTLEIAVPDTTKEPPFISTHSNASDRSTPNKTTISTTEPVIVTSQATTVHDKEPMLTPEAMPREVLILLDSDDGELERELTPLSVQESDMLLEESPNKELDASAALPSQSFEAFSHVLRMANSKQEYQQAPLDDQAIIEPNVMEQLQNTWRLEYDNKMMALEEEYRAKIDTLEASMTAHYREELGRALYYHSQALKHEWEAKLQSTLDAERQGRLARLEQLGATVSHLKSQFDLGRAKSTALELTQKLNTSVNVLKDLLDAEQDLFSFGHAEDMDDLANLLNTANPAIGREPAAVAQASLEYKNLLARKWKEKREREVSLFAKEWNNLNHIITRMGVFVESLSSAERAYFEPTFALLKATLDSRSALQSSISPAIATSYASLVEEFHSMVPLLRRTSLVDAYGPFLSHLLSYFASHFLLFHKKGLLPGLDAESVTARACYWLEKGDLDLAVRELAHLRERWPKLIAHDWLQKARARLEWTQMLQIMRQEMNWLSLQSY